MSSRRSGGGETATRRQHPTRPAAPRHPSGTTARHPPLTHAGTPKRRRPKSMCAAAVCQRAARFQSSGRTLLEMPGHYRMLFGRQVAVGKPGEGVAGGMAHLHRGPVTAGHGHCGRLQEPPRMVPPGPTVPAVFFTLPVPNPIPPADTRSPWVTDRPPRHKGSKPRDPR